MPQTEQDQVFSAHSAWITGLREHSTRLWGAAVPSPAALVAWGSVADQRAPRRALQRGPFDFVDDPVYRSASAHLSWQPANDELDFSDEPVYRLLGGFGSSTSGFAVDDVDLDVDVEAVSGSHEAWMHSACPRSCSGRAPSAI